MNPRSVVSIFIAMSMLAGAPGAFADQPAAKAPNAENGKKLFNKFGCYACHGMQAQGAQMTGPRLASTAWPAAAMAAFVRAPGGDMPPYAANTISDAQIADIHAWLSTLPKPADPSTIPLLR
jgi:mono/diheme cytochrome c family protein